MGGWSGGTDPGESGAAGVAIFCTLIPVQASEDAEKMRAGNARLLKSARGKIEALNK